jgi:hypothetical protein
MGNPLSLSLLVVVMSRPINQVACRMAIAALFDATLRSHTLNETKWKMIAAVSSQFGLEKASVNDDKFSKNMICRS